MFLKEALPQEFMNGEYTESAAMSLRDKRVLFEISGGAGWPGRHQNIVKMVVLETGHVVGWNENLSRGWTFPVRKGRIDLDGDDIVVAFRDGSILRGKENA